MIYLQRMTVSHADYVVGKYYISPFDLCDDCGQKMPDLFADRVEK